MASAGWKRTHPVIQRYKHRYSVMLHLIQSISNLNIHILIRVSLFTLFCLWNAVCSSEILLTTSEEEPLQFIVIGDWGMQGSRQQHQVAAQMERLAAREAIDFIISTGDNFYPSGVKSSVDPLWKTTFEDVYSGPYLKQIPWYIVLGNHDYLGEIHAQIEYGREHDNWILESNYYEKKFSLAKNSVAQFLLLDSSVFIKAYHARPDLYRHIGSQDPASQIKWLREKLDETDAVWRITVGHHPLYSSGSHGGSKELQTALAELFDKHHVDVYFAGHDHHLEHIKRIGPTHYFISGGGGARIRQVGTGEHTLFSASSLGFAHVVLDKHCMRVRFINETGKELYRTAIPAKLTIECE